ncbi:MAG: helix-turn-helix domain-containing protein [Desulfobacterales bacterium]|nr:helix-turn-helix domain-containing protein [Desulfobacterales bacterium]
MQAIRMLRELKRWTQEELARQSGLNAKNISHPRERPGRYRQAARQSNSPEAFKVHPAIIMFPEYEGDLIPQAA